MTTVAQFIDDLGGTVAVAERLDLAPTTVSSWKTSNSIPKWRKSALRQFAEQQGKEMPEQFDLPQEQAA